MDSVQYTGDFLIGKTHSLHSSAPLWGRIISREMETSLKKMVSKREGKKAFNRRKTNQANLDQPSHAAVRITSTCNHRLASKGCEIVPKIPRIFRPTSSHPLMSTIALGQNTRMDGSPVENGAAISILRASLACLIILVCNAYGFGMAVVWRAEAQQSSMRERAANPPLARTAIFAAMWTKNQQRADATSRYMRFLCKNIVFLAHPRHQLVESVDIWRVRKKYAHTAHSEGRKWGLVVKLNACLMFFACFWILFCCNISRIIVIPFFVLFILLLICIFSY